MKTKKTTYQTNFDKLLAICPDLLSGLLEPGAARKSSRGENSGLMDLNLDILFRDQTDVAFGMKLPAPIPRMVVALSHYYRHPSGDMIADPYMQIAVYPERNAIEALTFQDWWSYQEVYPASDWVNRCLLKDLNNFLRMWLKNCIDQRHSLAPKAESEVAA